MTREELIDQISGQYSFFKSFIEEYHVEHDMSSANRVFILFDNMMQKLQDDCIPESMYPRIMKMVDQLEINHLSDLVRRWAGVHDFEKYQKSYENTVYNSFIANKTFNLFSAIGFVSSNVVLIGANGSGKTMFANSIREELERTESGIVIPAQKILIFPTYSHIPMYQSAYDAYDKHGQGALDDKQTYNASQENDIPYNLIIKYGSEMKLLLSALLGERMAKRNSFCSTANDGDPIDTAAFRSLLDEVIEIWNDLIGHRELFCDDSCNLRIRYDKSEYPAYQMSDGEREIFYVVGRVLLAKKAALIIVDEPELHLHKSILNKLWDKLEQRRNDCMFIYLTHDIDFAASRSAKKCWLKSYSSSNIFEDWNVEPIPNDVIPDNLLMKLLGSRKRILFCEGKQQSLDAQIFEILFSNYTIVPVDSCKDVIDYTRAYNRIETRYAEAYGIIDADFRTPEQIAKLSTEHVLSYSVAEIENLFMLEEFIKGFAAFKREPCDFDDIKRRVLALFERDIDIQASLFVTQKINTLFNESHMKNGKTVEEVKNHFSSFTSQVYIEDWYNQRRAELEAIVSNNEYRKAIQLYNNKGLHTVVEKSLGLSSYHRKAIDYLKQSEEAKSILRSVFPNLDTSE